MAADAIVQEQAAVTARAAADVLANPVRRQLGVMHLFHVVAHVVHEREAEHRAVGASDEKRF